MADNAPTGFTSETLVKAWRDTEVSLPADVELAGVVYHGPDRRPGTEWIAFATDSDGSSIGPEGVGADPVSALRSLVGFMKQRGS